MGLYQIPCFPESFKSAKVALNHSGKHCILISFETVIVLILGRDPFKVRHSVRLVIVIIQFPGTFKIDRAQYSLFVTTIINPIPHGHGVFWNGFTQTWGRQMLPIPYNSVISKDMDLKFLHA